MQKKRSGGRRLKPKTENQAKYIRSMIESDVTICIGPAGTGKTTIAVGLGCQYLLENKVNKIKPAAAGEGIPIKYFDLFIGWL